MLYIVNYSDKKFQKKQIYQNQTAQTIVKPDNIFSFSKQDIDENFYKKNKDILCFEKGDGYWLWKPYFILKVLTNMTEDDYLFYCDAGAYFINNLDKVIEIQMQTNKDIIPFYNVPENLLERYYTKRDTFILMDCDSEKFIDTIQYMGGFHLWKKTDFTIAFLNEWISYIEDIRVVSDDNAELKENYTGFVSHRHDQSIFSLLCKKYDIPAYPDPTQFGNEERKRLNNSYLIQFLHHTKGDKSRIKRMIKRIKLIIRGSKK